MKKNFLFTIIGLIIVLIVGILLFYFLKPAVLVGSKFACNEDIDCIIYDTSEEFFCCPGCPNWSEKRYIAVSWQYSQDRYSQLEEKRNLWEKENCKLGCPFGLSYCSYYDEYRARCVRGVCKKVKEK